jgi:hypothetical protein
MSLAFLCSSCKQNKEHLYVLLESFRRIHSNVGYITLSQYSTTLSRVHL